MKSSLLGLDITPHALYLVELTNNDSAPQFQACVIPLSNQSQALFALKQALQQIQATSKQVAIALPYASVLFKTVELDARLTEDEIASQASTFVAQYFNTKATDLMFDFELLGPSLQNPQLQQIRWVAAKKQTVTDYLQITTAAGLTAIAVEVEVFALQRVVQKMLRDRLPEQSCVAVVLVKNATALLLVLKQKNIVYMREDNLDLEASDTVIRSIKHYLTTHNFAIPSQLFLAGKISFALQSVSQQTGIATHALSFSTSDNLSPEFALSIGLALRAAL